MIPKKVTTAVTIVAFAWFCSSAVAGPVKKQAFQPDEVSELNRAQLASTATLEEVDAGVFGLLNSVLGLGLTAAAAYLIWQEIEDD